MIPTSVLKSIPKAPGIYCLYGGWANRRVEAYVGIGKNLHSRISQHLIRRDSSVTTGASVVSLNPDLVTYIKWWTGPDLENEHAREAGEMVAFEILNPTLRSRGTTSAAALEMRNDPVFVQRMREVFEGPPSGELELPTVETLLRDIEELKRR